MPHETLSTHFDTPELDARLKWRNEPPAWRLDAAASRLTLETGENTDFWQETRYGFRLDNGHFLGLATEGDFDLETTVHFEPRNQYDQAGLMVRYSPDSWIKTSVEYEPDEPCNLGAVVTNFGFSDWSVQEFPREVHQITLQMCKRGDDFEIYFRRSPDAKWRLLRLAHLHRPVDGVLLAGLYACSPKGKGFQVAFESLHVRSVA